MDEYFFLIEIIYDLVQSGEVANKFINIKKFLEAVGSRIDRKMHLPYDRLDRENHISLCNSHIHHVFDSRIKA